MIVSIQLAIRPPGLHRVARSVQWIICVALIGIGLSATAAQDQPITPVDINQHENEPSGESAVDLSTLPTAVREVVQRQAKLFADARLHEIETRTNDDGSVRFVAEFEGHDNEGRLELASDGRILRTTGLCRVAPSLPITEWPAPVRATAERLATGNPLSPARRIERDGQPHFQTTFSSTSLTTTVVIAADGTLVSITSKALKP